MTIRTTPLKATILLALTGPLTGAVAHDSYVEVQLKNMGPRISSQGVPVKISCDKRAPNFLVALDQAMADRQVVITKKGEAWHKEVFGIFGYSLDLPRSKADLAMAQRVLELARRDNLVAAKLANDEAARASASYRASPFFVNMHRYIQNSSTPTLSDDETEVGPDDVWLGQVAHNIQVSQQALGSRYDELPVRYFVMGNAMDDGIAIDASRRVYCDTERPSISKAALESVAAKIRTTKPKK